MRRKLSIICTIAFIFLNSIIPNTVYAADKDEETRGKSISNQYINLTIEDDKNESEYCRFILSTNKGNLKNDKDDEKKLLYSNFYSSYTTININGKAYLFGRGEEVQSPTFNKDDNTVTAIQKFNDVEVKQTLKFTEGFTKNYEDMLEISYEVENKSEIDQTIGVRIMIDTFLGTDDRGIIEVDNKEFTGEVELSKDSIPEVWHIKSRNETDLIAYGRNIKNSSNPVDTIQFANWNKLFDNRWNYTVNEKDGNLDSAVAFIWNGKAINPKGKEKYTAYYGVKNTITEEVINEKNNDVSVNESVDSKDTSDNNEILIISLLGLLLASLVIAYCLIRKVKGELK